MLVPQNSPGTRSRLAVGSARPEIRSASCVAPALPVVPPENSDRREIARVGSVPHQASQLCSTSPVHRVGGSQGFRVSGFGDRTFRLRCGSRCFVSRPRLARGVGGEARAGAVQSFEHDRSRAPATAPGSRALPKREGWARTADRLGGRAAGRACGRAASRPMSGSMDTASAGRICSSNPDYFVA
jgi:hypothetical protein